MADDILGTQIQVDGSAAMDALASRVANAGLSTPSGINADDHLDNQEAASRTIQGSPRQAMAAADRRAYRENRLSAIYDWAQQAGSADEFNRGILGAFVGSDVATPGERERFVRQGLASAFPTETERPYAAFRRERAELEADFRDDWVLSGRGMDIGGDEYRSAFRDTLADRGFERREPTGPVARFREEFSSQWGPLNLAFAGGSLAQGGTEYYAAMHSGRYVTPEEQATAEAGLLPGAGAIAGTLIGMATPLGGWAGGMVGQSIGQVGQSVIGATEASNQAARGIGEQLSASLGEAASAAREFADAARATGAPLRDLQQVTTSALSAGVAGAGTIGGLGALTNALDENAVGDISALAQFTQRPTLYGIGQRLASGQANASDFNAAAWEAGNQGSFDLMARFQRDAQRAGLATNPDYQNYMAGANASRDIGSYLPHAPDPSTGILGVAGQTLENAFPFVTAAGVGIRGWWDARHADEIAEGIGANPQAAAQNANAAFMAQLRSQEAVGAARLDFAQGSLQLSRTGGAFASVADTEAYYQGLGEQGATVQTRLAADTLQFINPATPAALRPALQEDIYRAGAEARGLQVAQRGARRDLSLGLIGEEQASDSYNDLMAQLRYGRGANDLLSSRNSQADYLERSASSPGLSPTDRFAVLGESARTRYAARTAAYDESLAQTGLGIARAQTLVSGEEGGGTPEQVRSAQGAMLGAYTSQINELNRELQSGGLTVQDRIQRERELTDTIRARNGLEDQRRTEYYGGVADINAANQGAARAGLGRRVALGGSGAYADLLGEDAGDIADAEQRYNAAPRGTMERARAFRDLQVLREQRAEDADQSQVYRRTSAERIGDLRTQTAYQLSQIAPYSDGGDPRTASAGLLGNLQGRLAGVIGAERNSSGLALEQNVQQEEALRLQISQVEHDRLFADLRVLPEMVAGMPGGGYGSFALPMNARAAAAHGSPTYGSVGRPSLPVSGSPVNGGMGLGGPGQSVLDHALTGAAGGHTDALLGRVVQILESIERRSGSGLSGGPPAPKGQQWGAARDDIRRTFDPSRPYVGGSPAVRTF